MLTVNRTDMALESHAIYCKAHNSEPDGVDIEKSVEGDARITCVTVRTDAGALAVGRARGRYVTVEASKKWFFDGAAVFSLAQIMAKHIRTMVPAKGNILVVGLGNRCITPDGIGPACVEKIIVTRHLLGECCGAFALLRPVSALAPGVLGVTGIETAEIIRGVADRVKPVAVIAVDALASLSEERLCRAFQICDSGISPGAGAYNNREELSQKTLGVPVIAIGLPTVIEASALCGDPPEGANGEGFLVTPKDIDSLMRMGAKAIGYAINLALQGDMTAAEMEQFCC